eukprot:6473532-Amphidinium_carterae.2
MICTSYSFYDSLSWFASSSSNEVKSTAARNKANFEMSFKERSQVRAAVAFQTLQEACLPQLRPLLALIPFVPTCIHRNGSSQAGKRAAL